MSYILDALRRADAERERGAVPGLHTQQFGGMPDDEERPRRPRLLIAAVIALALALAAMLAWNYFAATEPPAKAVVLAQPAPPVAAVAPSPVAVVAPPPAAPQASASPVSPASATRPAAVSHPPPPRPRPRREPAPPPATEKTTPSATPEDRLYAFAELPDAIRRELPKLSYGGGSYGGDKASRLAFLNGQVFHEGDTIASGLVLRQVKQKGVILVYKGYRFELGT